MEVSHALLLEPVTFKDDVPPDSAAPKPKEVDLFHVFPHRGPHSPARFRKPHRLAQRVAAASVAFSVARATGKGRG